MNVDQDPLCCCEYFDLYQQRNHILACCCNCEDLDASCDSFIRCSKVPVARTQGLMATLQDRIRIPWRGGALKISFDIALPIILLPSLLLVASNSIWWTVLIFIPTILLVIFLSFKKGMQQLKFFYSWCIVSALVLFIIFEFIVVPLLEILISENCGVSLLGAIALCLFYFVKLNYKETEELTERTQFCYTCQIAVPEKHFHCVWLNCCIGIHNKFVFLLGTLFAIATLTYSSNLTLTSVCHPRRWIYTILVPDDCTGVYDETLEISLSFVSGIYSIIICNMLLIYVVYEIILIFYGWCFSTNNTLYNPGIVSNLYKKV